MANMNEEIYDDIPNTVAGGDIIDNVPKNDTTSNLSEVRVTIVEAKQKKMPTSRMILKGANPSLYRWFGVLMIIGAALILIFELVTISMSCYLYVYGMFNFYIGIWVSWIIFVTGIFQLRLFYHFNEVGNVYIILTIVFTWISFVTLLIGFTLALIFRFNSKLSCGDVGVLLVFSVSINFVTVISSLVCFLTQLCKKR